MALTRPTLTQIRDRVMADIEANIDQTTPLLRKAVLRIIGYVFAGLAHMLYGYIDAMTLDLFVDTCTGKYLDRWAAIFGITRKAASYASGSVVFSGTDGTPIPAGTKLIGSSEVEYATSAAVTIASGTATAVVTAETEGVDGNLAQGQTLTIVNPIAGVTSEATVGAGGIAGGVDEEEDEDLRGRLLARIQAPPQGGAASDYKAWALSVSGITRAWVAETYQGAGTVGVAVVNDEGEGSIIPPQSKLNEVKAYIDSVRPLCATVYVYAPTLVTVNMDIFIAPDTAGVRAAILAELNALFTSKGGPLGTIYLSDINAAISAAAGQDHHTLNSPTDDIDLALTQIAVVGTITWRS